MSAGCSFGQALVRNFEFYPAGRVGLDEVDKIPGNGSRRDLPQQGSQRDQRNHALQQSPHGATRPDVNRTHFQDQDGWRRIPAEDRDRSPGRLFCPNTSMTC